MLQKLTPGERNAKLATLAAELAHIETTQRKLADSWARTADSLVASVLPEISNGVCYNINRRFPTFLTEPRRSVFQSHRKILGVIKPRGYDLALSLLQAQFRAYLNEHYEFSVEALPLRTLARRRAALAHEIESLRVPADQSALSAATAGLRRETDVDGGAPALETNNGMLATTSLLTTLPQTALAGEPGSVEECFTPAVPVETTVVAACPMPAIATDDRLGYFS